MANYVYTMTPDQEFDWQARVDEYNKVNPIKPPLSPLTISSYFTFILDNLSINYKQQNKTTQTDVISDKIKDASKQQIDQINTAIDAILTPK